MSQRMRETPLVSILIPAYNAERFVAEAVTSALSQTYPRLEVIVVDDGSTDGTVQALHALRGAPNLTVIEQLNAGAAAARNRAFEASTGAFVKFFDADDLLSPDHIALQVNRIGERADAVAMGEWARFWEEPAEAHFPCRPGYRDADPVDWIVEDWSHARPMTQPAMFLLPRSLVEGAGGWDERLSLIDDFEFFARVLLRATELVFVPGARVYYRSGVESNLSGQSSRRAIESQLLALDVGTQHLLDAEDSSRTRQAAATMLQDFVYSHYPQHPDLLAHAQDRVDALGGSSIPPAGPPGFHFLRRFIGWRLARRVEHAVTKRGLNRASLWTSSRHVAKSRW